MKCPHCIQDHPDGFQFCPITGKKIELLKACINPDCPDYGKPILPPNSQFCPTCGTKLDVGKEINSGKKIEDATAQEQISSEYDEIQSFHEGMAVVRKGDKYGFINLDGKAVIPCKYDSASRFSEGLALVNKNIFIKPNGVIELKVLSEDLEVMGDFHCDRCAVVSKSSGLYGFVDTTGYLAIECRFTDVSDFDEGYALAWIKGSEFKTDNSRVVLLDTDGDCCYTPHQTLLKGFKLDKSEWDWDWRTAKKCNVGGIIVQHNNDLVSEYGEKYNVSFHSIELYMKDILCVSCENGILFYSDNDNHCWKWFPDSTPNYNYNSQSRDNRKYYAWGSFSEEGLQPFRNNYSELWGYISVENEVVIDFQYDDARIHSEGLAAVAKKGKWGYIDSEGNLVIPFSYSKVTEFSEGRAVVEKDGVVMVIDKEGKRIV